MADETPRLVWKKGNCVSDSIYGAQEWAAQHDVPVRIAISKISKSPDVDHAQAQVLIDGKWEWLTIDQQGPYKGVPRKWTQHFPVQPYRYVPLEDFMREQEGIEHVVPEEVTLVKGAK